MKIVIGGNAYDMQAIDEVGMLDLLELHKQTGLTFEDIRAGSEQLAELSEDGGGLLADPDLIRKFGAMVWLMRRKAGERDITFEQAIDFPLSEMTFETDEGDDAGND